MMDHYPFVTTVPVTDLARAKSFYGGVLGLKEVANDSPEEGVMFEGAGGSRVYLYKRGPTKADHTVFAFMVPDIRVVVDELRGKGVTFEDYDMPGLKTENGIATWGSFKAAWFKDTEGNIIGIDQK